MTELKILLCDDDVALQSLCARRLEKMGIKPDTTDNGRRAIELIKDNNYDLIITDIYMPEATGLEVLQFTRQLNPDTQVRRTCPRSIIAPRSARCSMTANTGTAAPPFHKRR